MDVLAARVNAVRVFPKPISWVFRQPDLPRMSSYVGQNMHTSARMPPRARFGFCRLDAPVTVFLYLQRFNQLVAIKVMDEYCLSSHRVCPALFLISSHRDG